MSVPAADPVAAGVQRMLAEQLAKQMLESTKPQGDDATQAPSDAYSSQFAGVLADAMTKGMQQ